MGEGIKRIFSGTVLLPFITLHHIGSGWKMVERRFLTKQPNAALAQNHMVNLLPLCQEKPPESSYTLLPRTKWEILTPRVLSDFSY